MTHTPIPWRAWPDGAITAGGPNNNDVVVAQVEMESTSEEQGIGDAHLIVTAVNAHEELLAALEHSRAVLIFDHRSDERYAELITQVEAAIAKAKEG